MKNVLLLAAHHSRKETGVGNPIIDKYGGECEVAIQNAGSLRDQTKKTTSG